MQPPVCARTMITHHPRNKGSPHMRMAHHTRPHPSENRLRTHHSRSRQPSTHQPIAAQQEPHARTSPHPLTDYLMCRHHHSRLTWPTHQSSPTTRSTVSRPATHHTTPTQKVARVTKPPIALPQPPTTRTTCTRPPTNQAQLRRCTHQHTYSPRD